MKLIFLVIALIFLVSCATTKCPVPEMTYLQKFEAENLAYVKGMIDKDEKLNENQKFLYLEFIKCSRNLIKNPHTVKRLMPWQTKTIYNSASNFCLYQIEAERGDITELLEILN